MLSRFAYGIGNWRTCFSISRSLPCVWTQSSKGSSAQEHGLQLASYRKKKSEWRGVLFSDLVLQKVLTSSIDSPYSDKTSHDLKVVPDCFSSWKSILFCWNCFVIILTSANHSESNPKVNLLLPFGSTHSKLSDGNTLCTNNFNLFIVVVNLVGCHPRCGEAFSLAAGKLWNFSP